MAKIFSIGEVLWDLFPDYKKPGGSPANIAYHAHCLGHDSFLVSKVGNDTDGDELIQFLQKKGLSVRFIQKSSTSPTGLVTVAIQDGEPSYVIHEPSAWDSIEFTDDLKEQITDIDAICFASLSQRNSVTAATVRTLLLEVPPSCLKVFDLNLRPPFVDKSTILDCIEQSDVIKMNEDECQTVSGWFDTSDLPSFLVRKWPDKTVIVTLGANGSAMYFHDGSYTQSAYPISGKGDFVGVGDAFLACFIHLMLEKAPAANLLDHASRYAAYVASQQGGMPEIPADVSTGPVLKIPGTD